MRVITKQFIRRRYSPFTY